MKIFKKIAPILVLAMVLALPIVSFAQGGKINTLEAKSENGNVTINGTASDGVLSVAVFVYDEAGNNLIDVGSAVVNDDKTFTRTVALPDGTYMVKVADYDGGDFTQALTNASAGAQSTPVTVKSSKTDDANNPYMWIAIFGGVVLLSGGAFVYKATRK